MSRKTQVQRPSNRLVAIAGFSVRSAAQSAIRSGWIPIGIDACGDRDTLAICCDYRRWSDDWIDWFDEVYPGVPLMMAGGMENQLAWIDRMSKSDGRCVVDSRQISQLRSLTLWKRWAGLSGLSFPRTWMLGDSPSSLLGQCNSSSSSQWLIKSNRSVGGVSIRECKQEEIIASASLDDLKSNEYLQEKIEGIPIGVTFLSSDFGSLVIGTAKSIGQKTQPFLAPYTYRGSYGPIPIDQFEYDSLHRFASNVQREVGIRGIWQADFVVSHSTWNLLEINPRWSASMEILEVALDLSLASLHLECAMHAIDLQTWKGLVAQLDARRQSTAGLNPTRGCLAGAFGKLVVFADEQIEVSDQQSNRWWAKRWQGTFKELDIHRDPFDSPSRYLVADIPCAGTRIEAGQPIFSLFSKNENQLYEITESKSWQCDC